MKRRRRIDPGEARAAAGGGLPFYQHLYPPPEKCCGKCQQPRYSVDNTGTCGYCRAVAKGKSIPAEEVPFPEEG